MRGLNYFIDCVFSEGLNYFIDCVLSEGLNYFIDCVLSEIIYLFSGVFCGNAFDVPGPVRNRTGGVLPSNIHIEYRFTKSFCHYFKDSGSHRSPEKWKANVVSTVVVCVHMVLVVGTIMVPRCGYGHLVDTIICG